MANESCAKKILTTRNPFPDLHTFVAILSVVIKGKRPKRPDMQECCDGLWNLLNQCWKDEPGDRPTTVKVLREVDKLAQSQGAFWSIVVLLATWINNHTRPRSFLRAQDHPENICTTGNFLKRDLL